MEKIACNAYVDTESNYSPNTGFLSDDIVFTTVTTTDIGTIIPNNTHYDIICDIDTYSKHKKTKRRIRCECCDALLPLHEVYNGIVKCEFCGAVQDSEDIIKD